MHCTRPHTPEQVINLARDMKVRFVLLQFTDIPGTVKSLAIPVDQLPRALAGEIMFDGSSVHGFARIEESDMLLLPDPTTWMLVPWQATDKGPTARLICSILTPDGNRFAGCPRTALETIIARADSLGLTMVAGPEAEFFLFHVDEWGRPTIITHDQGSYFDLSPIDQGEQARRDIVVCLQTMGFNIEAAHHEVAPGQHEIDIRYDQALAMADSIATFRLVVRSVAMTHNLHATFMPKPITGVNGSGMHTHQSLFRENHNQFYDPQARYQLSNICLHYISGLLKHARGFTAITNPLINSYKRLVPGYEAPVYIAWAHKNRSPLIRVPAARGSGTRVELRSPDPSCNPYLALTVMLAAGLDGIARKLDPPPPLDVNFYELTETERKHMDIATVPQTLDQALDELAADDVICSALGDHITAKFIAAKRLEADRFRTTVHPWEIDQYLSVV